MAFVNAVVLLSLSTLAWGQRPFFAGSRPIGYPEIVRPTEAADDLGNRFGEANSTAPASNIPTTTLRPLPIEALGDRDLVDRLSKLPVDQQPFWLLNWQALDANRKKPQTYPQRPSNFASSLLPSSPPSSGVSSSNSGVSSSSSGTTNANSGASGLDSRFSSSNSGVASSNSGSIRPSSSSVSANTNFALNDRIGGNSATTNKQGNLNKGSSVTTNLHPHRNQWSQSSESSQAGLPHTNKPTVALKPHPTNSNYFENINTFLESDSDPYSDYEEFVEEYRRDMKNHSSK